jgi:Beta-lactamase class C and other penicillin binding proteins
VLKCRETDPDIRLICAVPWGGFASRWNEQWKAVYYDVLKKADLVKNISDKYDDSVFQKRNRWMADRSNRLIAYFNGAEGGTKNMVEYAGEKGLEMVVNAPRDGAFERWDAPEAAGVSSAGLLAFLKAADKVKDRVQFHSMILLRHGKMVCKMNWEPYDDVTSHKLFSLSKSFTSCAAGFAVSEGLLKWDSPVTDILPEEVPKGNAEELRQITLENLLCMGSGLAEESDCPSPDPGVTWARHVLSQGIKYPPMTHFHYNTFGTYLVSCMVQKVTGQTVRDYLTPPPVRAAGHGDAGMGYVPSGRVLRRFRSASELYGYRALRSVSAAEGKMARKADPAGGLDRAGHEGAYRQLRECARTGQ